ncbi:MAG: hypothetical protein JOZ96_18375 [Acidobacteria bacterium]|nr:hypothetical protein [Acidobacteriota bacterium]
MKDELPEDRTAEDNGDAASGVDASACEGGAEEAEQPVVEQQRTESGDGGASKSPPAETAAERVENQVKSNLYKSPAEIVNSLSGNEANIQNTVTNNTNNYYGTTPDDKPRDLAQYITKSPLPPPRRSYQSVDDSEIAGYVGVLLTQRILLLGCRNKTVALNVAKSIAHQSPAACKRSVTVKPNCEGTFTVEDLIRQLAAPRENEGRSSQQPPQAVWVWEPDDVGEGNVSDVSNTILDSLFLSGTHVDQYQAQLSESGLYLICVIPPQRLQDYRSNFEVDLQSWEIDFLRPMLEEHGLHQVEELSETIVEQRRQGKWDEDDTEFYKEIERYLRKRGLPAAVADKARPDYVRLDVSQLFPPERQDPVADTVLYCATYYPDLSPQDFSQLVELFLEDEADDEEVKKSTDEPQNGDEAAAPPVPPSAIRRWLRDRGTVLRRCKLGALTDENNKRVVDFQVDGLRSPLSRHIPDTDYFFYESKFVLMRRQRLLFSPKKRIAEGARQLLVEMAAQYAPNEVANWLYEIVYEFEQAQAADLLKDRSPLFQLLRDVKVKDDRRYLCHGLSLVLSRLDKPDLQESARLFWLKLLQTQKRWFVALLWQMGNSTPAETLDWLKQVLDQGREDIRDEALHYLLNYLLRRDALVYSTLKELKQWSPDGQAGRAVHTLLILYCVKTNGRVPQQDYGRWPSAHPLFAFQDVAEAREWLKLLIGWLFEAASAASPDVALSIAADIIAGWYFILTPLSAPAPGGGDGASDEAGGLDSLAVRRLLLECIARHCSRQERRDLLEVWEEFRGNILVQVSIFEEIMDGLPDRPAPASLMKDAAAARRNLLATRALVGELRKDFRRCAAEVVNG